MEKEKRLAVLIDAENISSKYIDIILAEVNKVGSVIYKRIYGNWSQQQLGPWRDVIINYAIQPIQQFSNASGKNSSDSALIIETMDLLYTGKLDGFCIVSSDSDFTRLATRLRESEMYVMGMGEGKTPQSFVSACDKFCLLDRILRTIDTEDKPAARSAAKPSKPERPEKTSPPAALAKTSKSATKPLPPAPAADKPEPKPVPEERPGSDIESIRLSLKKMIEYNDDDGEWTFSGTLGNLLNKQFPDFDVRNFGYKKFVPFVESLGIFDTKSIPNQDSGASSSIYFKLK